jgi:putative ABC transport system permease protein
VRLALGATAGKVVRQIVGETLSVVYVGIAVGLFISFVIDLHLGKGMIYLPVFVGVPAILFLVATAACWVPARRASRVDPMIALRHE